MLGYTFLVYKHKSHFGSLATEIARNCLVLGFNPSGRAEAHVHIIYLDHALNSDFYFQSL